MPFSTTAGGRGPCANAGATGGHRMDLRAWENPWRLMLAVNAAVLVGVFLHKIFLTPYVPYIHLLDPQRILD